MTPHSIYQCSKHYDKFNGPHGRLRVINLSHFSHERCGPAHRHVMVLDTNKIETTFVLECLC